MDLRSTFRWCGRLALAAAPLLGSATTRGQGTPADVERRVDAVMAKLTADDKARLLAGVDRFYTRDVPAAGLRRFKMTDGPVGTRNDGRSTAYPAGVCLAASWDPALAEREGVALARDARCRGDHILLGPGVNICRSPLNGRNFEYFGEDPLLAGRVAAAYVRGVQSQGVAACVKHYACNNEEVDRETVDVRVSERALHEIYLPAFEAAIRDGHCRTVMSAYNKVNGTYSSANRYLLSDVLRDQWHFDGLVMSDWDSVHDGVGPLTGGLDLEMPGPDHVKPELVARMIADGRLTQAAVNDRVRRLVRVAAQMGWLDPGHVQQEESVPRIDPANGAVALDVAREGVTLLKNADGLLPLDRSKVTRVAVLGPDADAYVAGFGSSHVDPVGPTSLLAGLRAATPGVRFDLVPFHSLARLATSSEYDGGTLTATFYAGTKLAGPPLATRQDAAINFDWRRGPADGVPHDNFSARWAGKITPTTTGPAQFVIRSDDGARVELDGRTVLDSWSAHRAETKSATVDLTAGRTYDLTVEYFQGGGDAVVQFGYAPASLALTADERQTVASADAAVVLVHTGEGEGYDRPFALDLEQEQLIRAVAAANPHTVVVLESGANVAMKDWIDGVPALVDAWFPGQAGGRAVAEVIFGDVNPSGHLPDTFEKDWPDNPSYGHYPGRHGTVDYAEGIYVGYRGFDRNGVKPRFPFGHGLSYTTFDMRNPTVVDVGGGAFRVSVDVANTGHRAGATVAQLYVRPPAGGPVDRPPQELKGFARAELQPGETKTVTMTLDRRSFAHWDEATHDWAVVPGTYGLAVGRSSADICCTATADWK